MQLNNLIEGLNILSNYDGDPEGGYHLGAEHDQIYIYATDAPLKEHSIKRMCELGFFQPEVSYGDEFTPEDYDPSEGWSVHV
jgi:hypothetical protein